MNDEQELSSKRCDNFSTNLNEIGVQCVLDTEGLECLSSIPFFQKNVKKAINLECGIILNVEQVNELNQIDGNRRCDGLFVSSLLYMVFGRDSLSSACLFRRECENEVEYESKQLMDIGKLSVANDMFMERIFENEGFFNWMRIRNFKNLVRKALSDVFEVVVSNKKRSDETAKSNEAQKSSNERPSDKNCAETKDVTSFIENEFGFIEVKQEPQLIINDSQMNSTMTDPQIECGIILEANSCNDSQSFHMTRADPSCVQTHGDEKNFDMQFVTTGVDLVDRTIASSSSSLPMTWNLSPLKNHRFRNTQSDHMHESRRRRSRSRLRRGSSRLRSRRRRCRSSSSNSCRYKKRSKERRIIRVGRIEQEISKEDLKRKFSIYGPIENIRIHYKDSGRKIKYGFVTYERQCDAQQVINSSSKNPEISKYDISFGERREFCRNEYYDLDNPDHPRNCNWSGISAEISDSDSFEAELKNFQNDYQNRKSVAS